MRVAPKALLLTMFTRLFLCDLFIHGVGGGGYDQVTDGIIRRYFGIEPPRFVVASLTMFLPLGAHVVTDAEVQAATERLNRFEHNPDALICDVEFDSVEERERALGLAREKSELVSAMKQPDADKKRLGAANPRGQRRAARAARAGGRGARCREATPRGAAQRLGHPDRPHLPLLLLVTRDVADKIG